MRIKQVMFLLISLSVYVNCQGASASESVANRANLPQVQAAADVDTKVRIAAVADADVNAQAPQSEFAKDAFDVAKQTGSASSGRQKVQSVSARAAAGAGAGANDKKKIDVVSSKSPYEPRKLKIEKMMLGFLLTDVVAKDLHDFVQDCLYKRSYSCLEVRKIKPDYSKVLELSDGRFAFHYPHRVEIASIDNEGNYILIDTIQGFFWDMRLVCGMLFMWDHKLHVLNLNARLGEKKLDILNCYGVCSVLELKDGRLASCSRDGTVRIWDLTRDKGNDPDNDQRCVFKHSIYWRVLPSPEHSIIELIQLADEKLALLSRGGTIYILDLTKPKDFRLVNVLRGPSTGDFVSLMQLADGRLVARDQNSIHIWDMNEVNLPSLSVISDVVRGNPIRTPEDQRRVVVPFNSKCTAIIELKDGRLALGFENGIIRILDLTKPKGSDPCIDILRGHYAPITTLIQLADGRLVSSAKKYISILVWDLNRPRGNDPKKDQRCVDTLENNDLKPLSCRNVYSVIQLKNGRLFSSGDIVCIWDETGEVVDKTRLDLQDANVEKVHTNPPRNLTEYQKVYDKTLTYLARLLVVGLGLTKENMKPK